MNYNYMELYNLCPFGGHQPSSSLLDLKSISLAQL